MGRKTAFVSYNLTKGIMGQFIILEEMVIRAHLDIILDTLGELQ